MGGPNVARSNDGPGATVATLGEVFADAGNSASCPGDVLPEEERGLALDGDADMLEEEAGAAAIQPSPLSSDAEILTRRAASDEIHQSTPRSSVEGAHVVPDRCLCQARFFHPGHEAGRSKGFPLDVHQRLHSAGGKPEIEPSDSGADADRCSRGTWSHIHLALIMNLESVSTTNRNFSSPPGWTGGSHAARSWRRTSAANGGGTAFPSCFVRLERLP